LTRHAGRRQACLMSPLDALRTLEIAAERIRHGPQVTQPVRDALNALRGRVERWKLDWLWEHLQTDVRTSSSAIVGASQNLNAALNGISNAIRIERLGPVEMAAAVRAFEADLDSRD